MFCYLWLKSLTWEYFVCHELAKRNLDAYLHWIHQNLLLSSFHPGWIYISQPLQPKLGCSKLACELWLCSCHRLKWREHRDTHHSLGRSRGSQPIVWFCSYCTSPFPPRQTAPLLQQSVYQAPDLPSKHHHLQAGYNNFSQPQAVTLSLFKCKLKSPK